ncbi:MULTISPECIES: MATE family efflux transporter [unclassified Butyrivibrio]|uniref:MATE family efflux transporter n=1 Tax=unclassified Butyrivibrio TaxID=2639466 RepID=UPI0003B39D89|nr:MULTISPECIES: MATE family efflux transporter [unclassified Butyrivibrio]
MAQKTTTRNMTSGSILKQIITFSLPLMFGNIFQMLYNTVDSIVVGNFVGKEALAAVGSTTMIVNMLVFFFNGFSIGAGVLISRYFGGKDLKGLHLAIETTIATTLIFCVLFTIIGSIGVTPMLKFMATPEDVMPDATTYLRIYFLGFSGLLIYNMGSGILRAVGDTTRPLMFLILTSLMNIVLDLVFVIGLHAGIAGVAYATIISQMISAILTLMLLTRTNDIYKLIWKDLTLDAGILKGIFMVGLPAGIQSVITAFSNVFVQSYINHFGSSCMAGWSSYNKLDTFIMLPMSSVAMAATTFVSQNIGAGKEDRAEKGTRSAILLSTGITFVIAFLLFVFARPAIRLFSADESVIEFGALFIQTNVFFLIANCVNHTLAAALRGRGDSRGPMVIMIATFVVIRQIYLFVLTHFIVNDPKWVGFGYPVGWMCCCVIELIYYNIKWKGKAQTSTRPIVLDYSVDSKEHKKA